MRRQQQLAVSASLQHPCLAVRLLPLLCAGPLVSVLLGGTAGHRRRLTGQTLQQRLLRWLLARPVALDPAGTADQLPPRRLRFPCGRDRRASTVVAAALARVLALRIGPLLRTLRRCLSPLGRSSCLRSPQRRLAVPRVARSAQLMGLLPLLRLLEQRRLQVSGCAQRRRLDGPQFCLVQKATVAQRTPLTKLRSVQPLRRQLLSALPLQRLGRLRNGRLHGCERLKKRKPLPSRASSGRRARPPPHASRRLLMQKLLRPPLLEHGSVRSARGSGSANDVAAIVMMRSLAILAGEVAAVGRAALLATQGGAL